MKYKKNWNEVKARFEAWWNGSNKGRPLMKVVAKRKDDIAELEMEHEYESPLDFHLNVDERVKRYRNFLKTHILLGEAFPNFDLNIGPGSLAIYLGSEPNFLWDTVWFKECISNGLKELGQLKYIPDNYWWKKHIELITLSKELACDDFVVNIPDIVENIDILAAMRGPQNLCYDLVDEPEVVKDYIEQIDDIYFDYYDKMYDLIKAVDGSSSFTAFDIWGPGKTAKVQCDFSALMSPKQFCKFIQPSLQKQCALLDNSMYHLDGQDAIKHLDALMDIEELNAVQWTPGAGKPDGGYEGWYPIYDKVRTAGKSLWIMLHEGNIDDWIAAADKLVRRYGTEALYLLFPEMEEEQAYRLMEKAEKDWK